MLLSYQIGIIEVIAYDAKPKPKKQLEIAEGATPFGGCQFDILAIIAARNAQEAKTGTLIQDFEAKILDFSVMCATPSRASG